MLYTLLLSLTTCMYYDVSQQHMCVLCVFDQINNRCMLGETDSHTGVFIRMQGEIKSQTGVWVCFVVCCCQIKDWCRLVSCRCMCWNNMCMCNQQRQLFVLAPRKFNKSVSFPSAVHDTRVRLPVSRPLNTSQSCNRVQLPKRTRRTIVAPSHLHPPVFRSVIAMFYPANDPQYISEGVEYGHGGDLWVLGRWALARLPAVVRCDMVLHQAFRTGHVRKKLHRRWGATWSYIGGFARDISNQTCNTSPPQGVRSTSVSFHASRRHPWRAQLPLRESCHMVIITIRE